MVRGDGGVVVRTGRFCEGLIVWRKTQEDQTRRSSRKVRASTPIHPLCSTFSSSPHLPLSSLIAHITVRS